MSDELDAITEQQAQVDEAAGAVHFWRGKALLPFSFGRQSAWRRLGYDEVEDTMESAAAIIYLCTLRPEEVGGVRGERLAPFRLAIEQWADEHGITMNNPAGQEAIALGSVLWKETTDAQFMPVVKDSKGGPEPNPA